MDQDQENRKTTSNFLSKADNFFFEEHYRINVHRIFLKFKDPAKEKSYQEYFFKYSFKWLRFTIGISALFYIPYLASDMCLFERSSEKLLYLRFCCVISSIMLFMLTFHAKIFKKQFKNLISGTVIIGGIGILGMLLVTNHHEPHNSFHYYAGLLEVIVYCSVVRLNFGRTLILSFSIPVLYILLVKLSFLSMTNCILYNNALFLFGIGFMISLTCYSMEFFQRKSFSLDFIQKRAKEEQFQKIKRKIEMEKSNKEVLIKKLETIKIKSRNPIKNTVEQDISELIQFVKGTVKISSKEDFYDVLKNIHPERERIIKKNYPQFSKRTMFICLCIVDDEKSNSEIASLLNLSESTIKKERSDIREALDIKGLGKGESICQALMALT